VQSVIHDLHTARLGILFRYMFQKTYKEVRPSIFPFAPSLLDL
jgi:hypothetical protein